MAALARSVIEHLGKAGRKAPAPRRHNALDTRGHIVGALGAGVGQLLHDGRLHPHPAGGGCRPGAGAPDPGAHARLGRPDMRRLGRWVVPALLLAWWAPPALAAG